MKEFLLKMPILQLMSSIIMEGELNDLYQPKKKFNY